MYLTTKRKKGTVISVRPLNGPTSQYPHFHITKDQSPSQNIYLKISFERRDTIGHFDPLQSHFRYQATLNFRQFNNIEKGASARENRLHICFDFSVRLSGFSRFSSYMINGEVDEWFIERSFAALNVECVLRRGSRRIGVGLIKLVSFKFGLQLSAKVWNTLKIRILM